MFFDPLAVLSGTPWLWEVSFQIPPLGVQVVACDGSSYSSLFPASLESKKVPPWVIGW